MSDIHDSACYFETRRVEAGEMVCLSDTCVVCEDGKWHEFTKLWVL